MMVISFSWTTDAFLANRKSVTRREWKPEYARRFKPGDVCKAYDKQPRFGGKEIGKIKITSIKYEHISKMPSSDFEAEGFQYMKEKGIKIWGKDAIKAFLDWKNSKDYERDWYWVIRFNKEAKQCP